MVQARQASCGGGESAGHVASPQRRQRRVFVSFSEQSEASRSAAAVGELRSYRRASEPFGRNSAAFRRQRRLRNVFARFLQQLQADRSAAAVGGNTAFQETGTFGTSRLAGNRRLPAVTGAAGNPHECGAAHGRVDLVQCPQAGRSVLAAPQTSLTADVVLQGVAMALLHGVGGAR